MRLYSLVQDAIEEEKDDEPWPDLIFCFSFLRRLRVVRRFIDGRNPEISNPPLPDGSNLSDAPLVQIGWMLHRVFIRALHYGSLKIGKEAIGTEHIIQIYAYAMGFLYLENQRVPRYPVREQVNNYETYPLINEMYEKAFEALEAVARELLVESREVGHMEGLNREYRGLPYKYTQRETIEFNILSGRLQRSVTQVGALLNPNRKILTILQHFFRPSELGFAESFFSSLWEQELSFDRAHDAWHVEDVQFNKRVVVDDEEYEVMELLQSSEYRPEDVLKLPQFDDEGGSLNTRLRNETHRNDILKNNMAFLANIGKVNRLRRSHLLVRDWSKKRPWYFVYINLE